jgi:hypothetical protein
MKKQPTAMGLQLARRPRLVTSPAAGGMKIRVRSTKQNEQFSGSEWTGILMQTEHCCEGWDR